MAAITAELPVGIEVTQIADQPHIVDESVSEFVHTFAEALVIGQHGEAASRRIGARVGHVLRVRGFERGLDDYIAAGLTKFVIRPAGDLRTADFLEDFVAEMLPRQN